ncbi:MAG: stage 0 sporulation family protein [Clostridiales bacterium]|nr:stage 0 sporulation family protein [Clostridiales bacterium]
MTEIIGVRFKPAGKVYYFSPQNIKVTSEKMVIVETSRGVEIGTVVIPNKMVPDSEIIPPLRPLLRIATPEDLAHAEKNKELEREAYGICLQKIKEHKLDMNLVDVEYTFDNNKLLFYFTSDGRVDFRELVKDLAAIFKTRIELRQIGIRDEAKLIGGLGVCGRPFCCGSFLSEFVQVSIKMAKEQNFSLNSAKISGCCGRLMCCLRYEHEIYDEEIKKTPALGAVVSTPGGTGVVIETNPLAGLVRVSLNDKPDTPKLFHRDLLKVISTKKQGSGTASAE